MIARGSTLRYANQTVDLREVGAQLGARYVMEGNIRQSGAKLRVAVQLVDAISGAHLWAESYDRPFTSDDLFAIQDDLVPRIVSTVADQYGVLPRSMSEALYNKDESLLTPHEAVLRGFAYLSASLRIPMRAQCPRSNAPYNRPPNSQTAGRCCRCFTGGSTCTVSKVSPILSDERSSRPAAPWNSDPPITLRTSR